MTGQSLAQQAALIANQALTKIDLHMVQCTEANAALSASIRRLHARMDDRVQANRVMMVSVLIAAASGLLSIALRFWK